MNALFLSASDTKVSDAALYSLIGFLIVLAVLAVLIGIFYLTGFLFGHTALGKDKLFSRKQKHKAQDKAEVSDEQSDEELVAAITAAIAVVLESENDGVTPEFVIRRVTRKK